MRPALPRPFSIAPLEEALGLGGCPSTEVAARLNVYREKVERLRPRGLTVWQADELAVRAGLHPGSIWPDWWVVGADADHVTRR